MVMNWLRGSKYAAMLLTLIRLYLGWKWMTAGWHKITGEKAFDATGFLNGSIAKPIIDKATEEALYPNFVSFLENFALPNVKLFNVLVPWGEFLIGVGLLLGALTTAAVFFAMLMNFTFMLAGTLSSNPWLVLLSIFVIVARSNAGKIGLDHYILPYLRGIFTTIKKKTKNSTEAVV